MYFSLPIFDQFKVGKNSGTKANKNGIKNVSPQPASISNYHKIRNKANKTQTFPRPSKPNGPPASMISVLRPPSNYFSNQEKPPPLNGNQVLAAAPGTAAGAGDNEVTQPALIPPLEYPHQEVFSLTKYYSENKNSSSSLYPPSTDSNKPSIINPKIYYNQSSLNNSPHSTAYVTSSPFFYASPPPVPVNAIGKGSENI